MAVPPESVQVEVDNSAMSLRVTDAGIRDYHDVANALRQGRSVPATLSYDLRWSGATGGDEIRNTELRFAARFTEMNATMVWRAETEAFKFGSEPAKSKFAAIGGESNGIFFTLGK